MFRNLSQLLVNGSSVLKKIKSAVRTLFNDPEVLSFASEKAKLFAKHFSKNSNLDDLGTWVSVFLFAFLKLI